MTYKIPTIPCYLLDRSCKLNNNGTCHCFGYLLHPSQTEQIKLINEIINGSKALSLFNLRSDNYSNEVASKYILHMDYCLKTIGGKNMKNFLTPKTP